MITNSELIIDISANILMLLVMFCIILLWKKRTNGLFYWILAGAIVWIVSVFIKILIGNILNVNAIIFDYLKESYSYIGYLIIGSIWLGLLTGIPETYVGYLVVKRYKYQDYNHGVGIGIGMATIETLLIALSYLISLCIIKYLNGSISQGVINILSKVSWDTIITLNINRILALMIYIAIGILIVYSVKAKSQLYLLFAIILNSLMNGIEGLFQLTVETSKMNNWIIVAIFFPIFSLSIWICFKIYKKWEKQIFKYE